MQFVVRLTKLWGVLLFALFCGYFGYFNRERFGVAFPPWIEHVSLPSYALVGGAFLIGVIFACLVFGLDSMRKSMQIRRLTRQLRDAEARLPMTAVPSASAPLPQEPLP